MRYELKYGCNPNQKPAAISIDGELPIAVLNGGRAISTFLTHSTGGSSSENFAPQRDFLRRHRSNTSARQVRPSAFR